jgi:hypothetical protein
MNDAFTDRRTREDLALRKIQNAQWADDDRRTWGPLWAWALGGMVVALLILYHLPEVPV